MRQKLRATQLKIREKVPSIRNIANVKGRLRPKTLLHFSAKQWKTLISKIPKGKGMPKYGICLECYPIPDGDVLVQPVCIEGPCEICRIRIARFGPDLMPIYDCRCQPDRERCPDDPPPPPPTPLCRLTFRRRRGVIQLTCDSQGCRGRCRLTSIRENGRIMIVCQCRR